MSINNTKGKLTFTTTSLWSDLEFIEAKEVGQSIEMIYIQYSHYHKYNNDGTLINEKRVVKIVYSCVDGKWHKSKPIYGKIIPKQEYYEFED